MAKYERSIGISKAAKGLPGERVNKFHGIYIGYVKDNRDANKMGRLKVWIPEFQTDQYDAESWVLCSYASPFAGQTSDRFLGDDLTDYHQTQHSYGMWAVPPDVDVGVIVVFINGDPSRGVWFACVPDQYMNKAVPAPAFSKPEGHYGEDTTGDDCDLPVTEYNKLYAAGDGRATIVPEEEKKPVNKYHAEGLKNQGTIFDDIRGLTTASAMRESPSKVYGINTPGPLVPEDEGGKTGNVYKHSPATEEGASSRLPVNRKGGHSFVMDDNEEHEHIRLRTRSGAQILLDETNGIVYLSNKNGTCWVEMSESGHLDFYSKESVSFRSEKDFNLRADRDINIESGRNINIKSSKDYLSDPYEFLLKYANSQKKAITDCFTDDDKKEYIQDFKEINQKYKERKLTLDAAFKEALREKGFPTQGINGPYMDIGNGDQIDSDSDLSSVQTMALIRGSHNVGEGLGDSGEIRISAGTDFHMNAVNNMRLTAEINNMDIWCGQTIKTTAGMDYEVLAGHDYTQTSGMKMGMSCGDNFGILAGGDYSLNVLNDTFINWRGDSYVILEGRFLKVESQPVQFPFPITDPSNKRELKLDMQHETIIQLQDYDFSAHRIKSTAVGNIDQGILPTYEISSSDGLTGTLSIGTDLLFSVTSTLGAVGISGTTGVKIISGTGIDLSNTPVIYAATPTTGSLPIVPLPPTPAESNDFFEDLWLPTGAPAPPWAPRPRSAFMALQAQVPMIYSKSDVIEMYKCDGDKIYCVGRHRQIVESSVRRWMTAEPCIEKENIGNADERNDDVKNHLIFRNLN